MSETIRRRSLPDSLRYLADLLSSDTLTEAERVAAVVSLRSLADELAPPRFPCTCSDSARSAIGYCPERGHPEYTFCPNQLPLPTA